MVPTSNRQKSILREGIKLFVLNKDTDFDSPRAWISSGTLHASGSFFGNIPYCRGAFLPMEPWRELSPIESKLLAARNIPTNIGRWISVIRIPYDVLNLFDEIGVSSLAHKERVQVSDLHTIIAHEYYNYAIEKLLEYLSPFFLSKDGLVITGIHVNSPALPTVTHDGSCYIGLHLDAGGKLSLSQRDQARNRMCINLGCEDRFLLFINLTLMDMLDSLMEQEILQCQDYHQVIDLGPKFMARYPLYPVVKLRIRPKEAYIAPTENIVHDGCTLGKKYLDVNMTLRAHFNIPHSL